MLNSDSRNDLSHWSINIDDDHIAWLQIQADGKSVNVLTHAVMNELATLIDELEAADHLAGLALLSGKPGGFVYGADIHEFETLKTAAHVANHMELVHGLFNRIEALAVPSCVGIDGIAVGGGLEISLAFDRLFVTASPKTKLGFLRSILALCQAMAALAVPMAELVPRPFLI